MKKTNLLSKEAIKMGYQHALNGKTACLTEDIIVGSAYILLDFTKVHDFPQNHILVTEQTSPECTPAIEQALAVVTQRGGILCHAAIVCRDLKVPCIVGVSGILNHIQHGQSIAISTKTGTIYY